MQFDQERPERLANYQERDNDGLLAHGETRADEKHPGTTADRATNKPDTADRATNKPDTADRATNEPDTADRAEPAPDAGPAAAAQAGTGQPDRVAPRNGDGEFAVDLFDHDELEKFRGDWREVQNRFVDDPQAAVQQADRLVADVMRSLTAMFADHKEELEREWQHGSSGGTEDLRQALRHYRTYFNRLLST